MAKIIIADTGPIIALALVDVLPLMVQLYGKVVIPKSVYEEATKDMSKPAAAKIAEVVKNDFFSIQTIKLTGEFKALIDILDIGEAEALALAKKLNGVALIDEKRGRKVASKLGIPITGSAAVIINAKQNRLIHEVKPLLKKLAVHGYRMSDSLVQDVLKIAQEV